MSVLPEPQQQAKAFRIALVHMTLNLIVTAGYLAGFAWRHGSYHHPGPVAAGPLALSAVCLALLGVSGFLGGKLAFRYGVRVADEAAQASGYTSPHPATAVSSSIRWKAWKTNPTASWRNRARAFSLIWP